MARFRSTKRMSPDLIQLRAVNWSRNTSIELDLCLGHAHEPRRDIVPCGRRPHQPRGNILPEPDPGLFDQVCKGPRRGLVPRLRKSDGLLLLATYHLRAIEEGVRLSGGDYGC